VPLDPAGFDAALLSGRSLAEAAPRSPARPVIRRLAADLARR
jgi:Flp pilus assembly CpaE family ATPase